MIKHSLICRLLIVKVMNEMPVANETARNPLIKYEGAL